MKGENNMADKKCNKFLQCQDIKKCIKLNLINSQVL